MKQAATKLFHFPAYFRFSDTMDNLGAFITLNGKDMIPNYTTYMAVVSSNNIFAQIDNFFFALNNVIICFSFEFVATSKC